METQQAIEEGINPEEILSQGLIVGMERIGIKFKISQVFVSRVLMNAKAMSTTMKHLTRFFKDGSVKSKGKFIIGIVENAFHDIGKIW